ncbi:MAG TPA: DUF4276 family protein [Thermoanaerobaculia bacterium]
MVTEIRIYLEGGGDRSESRAALRQGFSRFLQSLHDLARAKGSGVRVVLCGPRQQAYRDFQAALRTNPEALNVLLVDSEEPVSAGSPREHLRKRSQDGWHLDNVAEEKCHLMVQAVEAWLIADPDTLATYYGQGFLRSALPKADDVETVDKSRLHSALAHATEKTRKKRYHKIRHCSDLLARIDPKLVRQRARHCDRLFAVLEETIETL